MSFPVCNRRQITTATVVVSDNFAFASTTNESFNFGIAFVVIVLVVIFIVLVRIVVPAGSGGGAVDGPIAGVLAGGAVGVATEVGVLGGKEAAAVDKHLLVDEGAEFAGFGTRVPDPMLRCGAIEAERVVLEDKRGGETVLDPLVGDEGDVFGGHGRKRKLGFRHGGCWNDVVAIWCFSVVDGEGRDWSVHTRWEMSCTTRRFGLRRLMRISLCSDVV